MHNYRAQGGPFEVELTRSLFLRAAITVYTARGATLIPFSGHSQSKRLQIAPVQTLRRRGRIYMDTHVAGGEQQRSVKELAVQQTEDESAP